MNSIEFYFDPSCPFSWITSRWLILVSREREIAITWRQFSLALKNNELDTRPNETAHAKAHREAHRAHRVIWHASQLHTVSALDLYSEIGMRCHIMERPIEDEVIREALESQQLPVSLLAAADDTTLDEKLQQEIDSATEVAGNNIGVPTIIFTNNDNVRVGYFGPVLRALPETTEESLALWDGILALATSPNFTEIKRSQPDKPDVFSTARC